MPCFERAADLESIKKIHWHKKRTISFCDDRLARAARVNGTRKTGITNRGIVNNSEKLTVTKFVGASRLHF